MDQKLIDKMVDEMPDDVLQHIAQSSMPWSSGSSGAESVDEDGFSVNPLKDFSGFSAMQMECWNKFVDNPQINSHVRDFMGNLTGAGFETISNVQEIADVIEEIETDPRNSLYINMTKYAARSEIEGELFLSLTLHNDGFVEVDFMDPSSCKGGGDDNSGIYFHSKKKTFPLMYRFECNGDIDHIPSINLAYYPEMISDLSKRTGYSKTYEKNSRTSNRKMAKLGGFRRFIVAWDRGFLTKRNVSHIKTTIIWINHYENLKKWEIDHKKSSGSYLWVASIEDPKAYRTWLKLTQEQKESTGLFAKKTPGGTIVLPPGIKLACINPSLPKISDGDTDIMHMVTSGLNTPEDMVTGVSSGSTFSGVNASRAPLTDRIGDQVSYFERFLRYDFWRPIFFLRSTVTDFPTTFKVKEAVDFKDKEPVMKTVSKKIWQLIDFEFPTSEVSDAEAKARAYLGVKHPSVVESLGIPREEVARKLGFKGYKKKRLKYSTEEEFFPELPLSVDLEEMQATSQEPSKSDSDGATEPVPDNKNKKEQVKPADK